MSVFIIVSNVVTGTLTTCVQVFTLNNISIFHARALQGLFINITTSFLFYANLRSVERYRFSTQILLAVLANLMGWFGFSWISQRKDSFSWRSQGLGLLFTLLNVGVVELQKRYELN